MNEWARVRYERRHHRHIDRSFAFGLHELTVEQYSHYEHQRRHDSANSPYCPFPDSPVGFVRWFQAARYCRWLNE